MLSSSAKTNAFALVCATVLMAAAQAAQGQSSSAGGGAAAGSCPGEGDCCEANGSPGCDDATCCNAICTNSPQCCVISWSQFCADQAALDTENCAQCQECDDPAGDCCSAALMIGDGPTPYSTIGNTTDGVAHAACPFDGQTYHDNWYTYQATCTGEMTASTCNDADYDTDIVVYDGCVGDWACPPGDDLVLGCNDDGPACAGFTSFVTVGAIAGNCYTVRVGGWMDGDMGSGILTMSCVVVAACGDGNCDPDENPCSCPEDCPGVCPCVEFDNKAEFEAFNEEDGKVLKGVETFEEGILPPASVDGLDDPLCGGVANAPDAFPYPNGLDQLNICVQSNILGAAPTVPAPQGLNGLAAASAAFLGIVSDVVLSNNFVNGWDLMLTTPPVTPGEEDDHTGVGFNPIASLGGVTVDIQVFNKSNALLASSTSPSSENGSTFWGIWCEDPIGRINIFDPGNGSEGADNIQLWVGPACGDCPTDVDGNGQTEAFDLAVLLGNWGPASPDSACLDADEDGIIGAFDLAVLLGAWGPCP